MREAPLDYSWLEANEKLFSPLAAQVDGLSDEGVEGALRAIGVPFGRTRPADESWMSPVLYYMDDQMKPKVVRTHYPSSRCDIRPATERILENMREGTLDGPPRSPKFQECITRPDFSDKDLPPDSLEPQMGWFRRKLDRILSLFDDGMKENDAKNPYSPPKS